MIPTCRTVQLVDAQANGRPLVNADLYRDYPTAELEEIESSWTVAREQLTKKAIESGRDVLEHGHWDWRYKSDSVETGYHRLIAIECNDQAQGLMAILAMPRRSRLGKGHVIYVDFLESAPWNLKAVTTKPKYFGVGTVLIADAIRVSHEAGLGGRIGLHSLPQAEDFYERHCKMKRGPADSAYYDLTYFEYTNGRRAMDWLISVGESV